MQSLLGYLFEHFVAEMTPLCRQLLQSSSVKLQLNKTVPTLSDVDQNGQHKLTRLLTQQSFQQLQFLIAKGYVKFSPSALTVSLSKTNILFYQRIYKLKYFAQKHLDIEFTMSLQAFIQGQMLPFACKRDKIYSLLSHNNQIFNEKNNVNTTTNSKRKKQDKLSSSLQKQSIDYSKMIYEYSSKNNDQQKLQHKQQSTILKQPIRKHSQPSIGQYLISIEQLTQLLRFSTLAKHIHSRKQLLTQHLLSIYKQEIDMDGLRMYQQYRQNKSKQKIIDELIHTIRKQQIEEWLLQLFAQYNYIDTRSDNEEQDKTANKPPQRHDSSDTNRNVLLVYNLLTKHPYMDQKQLLLQSQLTQVQLRKCVNLLIRQGLLHVYQQNVRSMLYKTIPQQEVEKMFVEQIAQSLLNHHIRLGDMIREKSMEQAVKYQCIINRLDDVLLIMGY